MLNPLSSTTLHATPNAEMRRYAGASVAVWRTTLPPGGAGPVHTIDREQIVVVLDGELSATVGETTLSAHPGDAVVLPAGVVRQVRNDGATPAVTLTSALPGSRAQVGDATPVDVPWST